MSVARMVDLFSAWLDMVAGVGADLLAWARRRQTLRVSEGAGGVFSLVLPSGEALALRLADADRTAGLPRVVAARLKDQPLDLHLDGGRVLVRALDLPGGAVPFLDGIVRTQIDRLTPWSPDAALYGWTPPEAIADERIRLKVAATPRAPLAPVMARLRGLGVGAIFVTATVATDDGPATIRLLDQAAGVASGRARVRAVLLGLLATVVVLATGVLAVSEFVGRDLDAQLEETEQNIAAARRLLLAARDGPGGGSPAERVLERRKREVPAAVLVLESLSKVLPDDTYVTDLQLDTDKVRIAGVSGAPADLVRLMEQSGDFTEATFVAPTTPMAGGHGERFDIEARIVPPAGGAPPAAASSDLTSSEARP
ncbi:PilN domain-containing protein [Xanthobacter sp. V4C-4]|uniref:PilN domain-containing protein n=1 Tax=Xanthobacter cornucopiae TaxID=3119924 RepID=UPI003729F05A